MKQWRKAVFWIHLVSGLVTGGVVLIMSVTGILIAFEEEILEWIDHDVSRVSGVGEKSETLAILDLRERLVSSHPDFIPTAVHISSDPERAYAFYAGREGHWYVDPVSGAARPSEATEAHELIHEIEEWHRFLGMKGDRLPLGKFINGVCNLAFFLLCLTGIILWIPRRWSWKAVKPSLLIVPRFHGKARDFNWHNVTGFWFLLPLVVLSGTAVVISFEWGHRLPFLIAGEEPPESRNFGMMAVPPAVVPTPPIGAVPISLETAFDIVARAWPDWEEIALPLPDPGVGAEVTGPLHIDVTLPDYMPSRAYLPVELDPYTGVILQSTRFEDRSPGLRARVWIRFLHTGGAFGLPGKIVATIATAASLILIWTGFALSWRRFFRKAKATKFS